MPTPKVVIFGPFSKIESKIRKISKFQNNTVTALVDEFHRNLRQMKGLDPYFRKKIEIFDFRSFLHVSQYFEHEADPDFRKSWKFPNLLRFQIPKAFIGINFFQKIFSNFFLLDLT